MSAAWSPRTRAEMVDYCPILFAMRGLCFGTASGPVGARLDSAKFARDLKVGGILPAGLEGAGFGLRYSSLIWMLPQCYIEEDRNKNVHSSTEPMEGTDGRC